MALIVSFINQSNLSPVSNYKVDVWVNDRHIAGPFYVNGHARKDGWEALVQQFARGGDLMAKAKPRPRNKPKPGC